MISRKNDTKTATYIIYALALITVGRVWFKGIESIATYLGLLSAGVAIALKDPITNITAWMFILWRSPFTVGDRIEIGKDAGDVIDVNIFKFTILLLLFSCSSNEQKIIFDQENDKKLFIKHYSLNEFYYIYT